MQEEVEEGRQGRKGRRSGDLVRGCVAHMFTFSFYVLLFPFMFLDNAIDTHIRI